MKNVVRASFIKQEENTKAKCLPIHQKWSTQLRNGVTASRCTVGKWSLTKWSLEFAKLNNKVETSHIQQVLDWYCSNIGKPYIPIALSGEKFRRNFDRIEAAMNKSGTKVLEITKEVQSIVTKLSNIKWSYKHLVELPNACQISSDNYNQFLQSFYPKLRNYRTQPFLTKQKSCGLFPEHFAEHLTNTESFVLEWFGKIAYKTNNPAWHGPLSEVFDIKSDRFIEWGKQIAYEYGNPKLWDTMFKEFKLSKGV